MPTTLPPDNAAIKIEGALYDLFTSLTGASWATVYTRLPGILKAAILPTLQQIVTDVKDVVNQLLEGDTLTNLEAVLDSGMTLASSPHVVLIDAVEGLAGEATRFLSAVTDLTRAGLEHLHAMIDLLFKVFTVLGDDPTRPGYAPPVLSPATIATLQGAGVIPP
jgi:hypothetical protein